MRVIPQTDSDDPVTVHTPVQVEFTYWNYVADTVLNVSMILNNVEEFCVFASASDFSPRPAGLIRHTVTIPGDLLNAGSYYINMIVVKDASVGILFQNNVVGFEVVEGEIVGNWYGRLPGATRPKLHWETDVTAASRFASRHGSQRLIGSDIFLAFRTGPLHPRWVSVGNNEIWYISNNHRTCSHHGVTTNRNSVGDAGTHPDRRALTDLHEPAGRNTRRDARKFVHYAVVVDRALRVDDAEIPDLRPRSHVRIPREWRRLFRFLRKTPRSPLDA